jgi:hypothetical protein
MNWGSNEEFEEVFGEIRKELYKDDFFSLMMIENAEKFFEFLREHLQTAQDNDVLSDILKLAMDDYNKYEIDLSIDELSDKGLIRMVVDGNGQLAYEATEAGLEVNDLINNQHTTYGEETQTNYIMDMKYSPEIFRVTGTDDALKFIDHGDNFEFIVIPAGKQHNGDEFVEFYHTIFTHYNDPGPNGQYELVDEVQLYDMLNNNYNQSK